MQRQTETGIHYLTQAEMFSNLKLQLHKVIGVAFPAFPLVTVGLYEDKSLWWLSCHGQEPFIPQLWVVQNLFSSGTLGLNFAGDEAQDSNGTDLWGVTKDSFSGLSLTFLLPCICSALSIFFEMSCKSICPTGICQIFTFLWCLGSGSWLEALGLMSLHHFSATTATEE